MTRTFKISLSLVMSALFMLSTVAFATVTFDASNGTGFIGRGDVITYVGKSGLVDNPVIFFADEVTYQQTCSKEVEVGRDREEKLITHTFKRVRQIGGQIQYDTRKAPGNGNITGYILTGYVGGTGGYTAPASLCPNDNSGFAPDGPLTEVSSSGGSLTFNGVVIPR